MDLVLSDAETRILGTLIEKSVTTPDYYPMTLNALTNGCNQKSNREPVVDFAEETVVRGLDSLRQKKLISTVSEAGSRVPKYSQDFGGFFHLSDDQVALMCVLMLRGPQTAGEINGRCSRLHAFGSREQAEETLDGLVERGYPLAVKLPRQTGRKERRYAHLLSGGVAIEESEMEPPFEAATLHVRDQDDRQAELADEVRQLRDELDALKAQFATFRRQFD
ncbi:MAG TPA: DUF480 domain-containing protein [Lentisphaeria bacterium]|nr:DUF480 domain-containing protein [Lentisphaeria bacterium]|tara:strand:- start:1945 stop:2607 length:663 start_codon:yes stop_codon:yes gene_type:complete